MDEIVKANIHKRNRHSDCFQEDSNEPKEGCCSSMLQQPKNEMEISEFSAKKARGDVRLSSEAVLEDSSTMQSSKSNEDDYDDDDYDDFDADDHAATLSDNEDFLEDYEDDVSVTSASTTVSTGSSVCSNTPSLVGENLESFSLGESEKVPGSGGATDKKDTNAWAINTALVQVQAPPLRRSLFSNVPPTMNFVHHNEVSVSSLPAELRKLLRWKLSNITPAVVKKVVTNSGFRLMRKTCSEWGGTWGKHMKAELFKELHECQKINHLPGTFNIGRKDRLWKNYHKLRLKHGKEEFSFLPRTFCLPADTKLLKKVWEKRGCRAKWIVKPPALARGTGISVVNKWSQIPKTRPLIVQKYVAKPHLINDTKYDLRIYVLLTSLHPLRLYLYDEGLVRFASNPYRSDSKSLSDVFTHLTNYSINKNSSSYCPNEDSEARQGHKWTLSSLWQHFSEKGIDNKPIIESIKDLVIKTIISAENCMHNLYRQNMASHYCGYELFGFDVLLDAKLKPWLIEVNISPSLHSSSPLDLDVKSPLATEVFNLVRYHVPPAKMSAKSQKEILDKFNLSDMTSNLCLDKRLYSRELSKAERSKHDKFQASGSPGSPGFSTGSRQEYLESIIDYLTPDDVRCLIRAEDELVQATHFSRIFPTQDTHNYFKFFEEPRYYNFLMDAWETRYGEQRAAAIDRLEQLCQDKHHLKMPKMVSNNPNSMAKKKTVDVSQLKAPTPSIAAIIEDAQHHCIKTDQAKPNASPAGTGNPDSPTRSSVKAGKISVTAKPHGIRTSFSPIGSGKMATQGSQHRKSLSSPEPMSTGGDSERSRSPSPTKDDQDEPPTGSPLGGSGLDNVILQTTTSVSSSISGPLPVTGSSISTSDSAALVTTTATTTTEAASEHNCNFEAFEATHNHNNANDTNDNNFVASQHNSADSTAQNIINGQDNR